MARFPLIFILSCWYLVDSLSALSIEQPCQRFIDEYIQSEEAKQSKICNTPECVKAAYTLIQNMDPSVEPCEDFYQYACGGFEERVSSKQTMKCMYCGDGWWIS